MKAFLLALALLLPGCAMQPKIEVAPLPDLWPEMPANIAAPCDAIDASDVSNMGKLVTAYERLIGDYVECAQRNQSKADWFKKVRPLKTDR